MNFGFAPDPFGAWAEYLRFRDGFEIALDPALYPIRWLDQIVAAGAAQFWSCDDAALITEIKAYPSGANDIHVMIAAGNAQSVVDVLRPQAEKWAIDQGCIGATIESRIGWARMLKPLGYALHQTTVRKVF